LDDLAPFALLEVAFALLEVAFALLVFLVVGFLDNFGEILRVKCNDKVISAQKHRNADDEQSSANDVFIFEIMSKLRISKLLKMMSSPFQSNRKKKLRLCKNVSYYVMLHQMCHVPSQVVCHLRVIVHVIHA